MTDSHLWWQTGVLYQIYPRSFQDSNGDGIGDLPGILARLDYLQWLGVDAIWISPMYPSPMADFGYDVADYTGVHPDFGTLADVDRLIAAASERGMRVLLDLVPNHSSDQHPWFQESRSSRESERRDWYIWRDAAPGGGPPNNWRSVFGGSAWEWDEATGQYYYHAFLTEQPDLNWRNPDVERAMLDVMRFWLDRGVAGFRIDVLWHLIKDERLRDNPPNPDWKPGQPPYDQLVPVFSTDQPEVHDIAARMRSLTDEYDARVLIGEVYLPIGKLVAYYGRDGSGVHLPFNFQLVQVPWEAEAIYSTVTEYEAALPEDGWPNWVLGNHDKSRIATRVGDAQARVAALLLLTLRGTPTLYYGDELGMQDGQIRPDQVQDPQGRNLGVEFSRDPQRTPMPWDGGANAGFTRGDPWLPLGGEAGRIHVDAQRADPASMLALHRRLLRLRRQEPALQVGAYVPAGIDGDCFGFIREDGGDRFLVVVNLGHGPVSFEPAGGRAQGTVVLATDADAEGARIEGRVDLAGDQALIVQLDR